MIREPREVPTSYIDDANDNPFLSIGTLLVGDLGAHIREKVPTKTLAKAIRESGIYELGAFSELGLADEDGEAKALGALALQDAWEADSRPREYKDSRSPVELFCDIFKISRKQNNLIFILMDVHPKSIIFVFCLSRNSYSF